MKSIITVRASFLMAGLFAATPLVARAGTIVVTNTNDAGAGSLRAAIESANAQPGDDTIDLSQVKGVIELTSILPDLSSNISLVGPGASVLNIQRKTGANAPKFRLLTITNGTQNGPTVSLSGLKLSNGAVINTPNELIEKTHGYYGGGVFSYYSTLTVRRCEISGGSAFEGGGLFCLAGKVGIYETTFADNNARIVGGGLTQDGSILLMDGCTFSGNSAGTAEAGYKDGTGGGAFLGGLLLQSKTSVVNSTFSGNVAGRGGGLNMDTRSALLANSTITNNRATRPFEDKGGGGGGVWMEASGEAQPHMIGSCLIVGNPQGNDVLVFLSPVYKNFPSSLGYNLIGSGASPGQFAMPGDQTQIGDPKLGPLQNNGGVTFTHLPASDSLVIDKGHWFGEGPAFVDQRGQGRSVDFPKIPNASGNDATDVGAVEVVVPSGPPIIIKIPPIKLPPRIPLPHIGPLDPGPR